MADLKEFNKSAEIYSDTLSKQSDIDKYKDQINKSKELISDTITRVTLSSMPFFGVLLSSTKRLPSNSINSLVGTNGDKIIYNINEVPYASIDELEFALTHVCMHIAFEHFIRGHYFEGDFTKKWHKACDITINNRLSRNTDLDLPSYALVDLDEYRGYSAEQIADEMEDKDLDFYDDIQSDNNKTLDKHYTGPSSGTSSHEKVRDRLEQAHEVSKGRGNTLNSVTDRIEGFNENKVDWRQVLRNFVGEKINREEYSLSPPDRQFLHMYDACIPSMRGREIGDVIVSVDTSGSIYKEQLKDFLGEVEKLENRVSEITILLSNTMVYDTIPPDKVRSFISENESYGYQSGGTSHVDVFKKIRDEFNKPELFIGFTDGATQVPNWEPGYPVIWTLTQEGYEDNLDFGRKIYIPDDRE